MTNPHSTTVTDIDIRAAADQVIAQMQQGRPLDALRLLESERQGERPVVQEALDRYVVAGLRGEMDELHRSGELQAPEHISVLERLRQAALPPRMPEYNGRDGNEPNELVGLTAAQRFDVYASIVETRGTQAAVDALRNEESVLLGLRKETSTLASMNGRELRGTGTYDDHIIVLRKQADGEHHVFIADRSNTEPTDQYDHHAQPRRGREVTPYADVAWRRRQGEDVNGDGIYDLGRLAEGTIEMVAADHPNPRSAGTMDAFRPSREQLASPRDANGVQRDSNGDGWFTQADINGAQNLNSTFKIHSGSRQNNDSAGCQTIHPDDYLSFIRAAQANDRQDSWQYVLTSTGGGLFHDVNRGAPQELEQPQPRLERGRDAHGGEERYPRPPDGASVGDSTSPRFQ